MRFLAYTSVKSLVIKSSGYGNYQPWPENSQDRSS